ncbi:MAG: hypothetical protein WCV58_02235 [Patescibacteria group bacterium]|jgi:hypothetical protein
MKIKSKIKQKTLIITILILSFSCLATALYFSPFIQNNRYIKAHRIEQQAKKYSLGSNEYQRLMAIANAIRKGEKNYTYTPNSAPVNSVSHP